MQRNGAKCICLGAKQYAELGLAEPRRVRQYCLEHGLQLAGEPEMMRSASAVAACCSHASDSSRSAWASRLSRSLTDCCGMVAVLCRLPSFDAALLSRLHRVVTRRSPATIEAEIR